MDKYIAIEAGKSYENDGGSVYALAELVEGGHAYRVVAQGLSFDQAEHFVKVLNAAEE